MRSAAGAFPGREGTGAAPAAGTGWFPYDPVSRPTRYLTPPDSTEVNPASFEANPRSMEAVPIASERAPVSIGPWICEAQLDAPSGSALPSPPASEAPLIPPASSPLANASITNPVFIDISSVFRFLLLPFRRSTNRFLTSPSDFL